VVAASLDRCPLGYLLGGNGDVEAGLRLELVADRYLLGGYGWPLGLLQQIRRRQEAQSDAMTFKRDRVATAHANFLDSRSYVSHRLHPSTEHPCIYLKGKDVGVARLQVFEREKGICWNCGKYCGWDEGEMHHLVGGLGAKRCWCQANLGWNCRKCHREKHVRVRWRKKA